MALSMYYNKGRLRKSRYLISDEFIPILYQIHNNSKFPQLTWLIDNLYENLEIEPDIAKALFEEMQLFEKLLLSLHLPFPKLPILKMQAFLQQAVASQQVIYTTSD